MATIMQLIGGSSSLVAAAPNVYQANTPQSPVSITVASVVNSTATTPNYSVLWTNDPPQAITPSSSSPTAFSYQSTGYGSSVTWFSSNMNAFSSNSFVNITWPVRAITIAASAGSTNQTIVATITQAV
jgi:hypothetical protein